MKNLYFFSFLYCIAGVFIAPFYCFLAGWDGRLVLLGIVAFSPIFLIIEILLALNAGIVDFMVDTWKVKFDFGALVNKEHLSSNAHIYFWLWTSFCSIPIVLHWTAYLFMKIGYQTLGMHIDNIRYSIVYHTISSICLLGVCIYILMLVYTFLSDMYTKIFKKHKSSSIRK